MPLIELEKPGRKQNLGAVPQELSNLVAPSMVRHSFNHVTEKPLSLILSGEWVNS